MMENTNGPKLNGAVPIYSVENMEAALAYYQNVLGFVLGWKWGEPPYIASVCRDNVELMIAKRGQAGPAGSSKAYIYVANIDALYKALMKNGAKINIPLEVRPYGMRDFGIQDPDGNELHFGEEMAK